MAIDNAKRKFDINIEKEIKRIKNEIIENAIKEKNIVVYNDDGTPDTKCIFPRFWYQIKQKNDKRNGAKKLDKQKLSDKINLKINAPMNYVYDYQPDRKQQNTKVIPINDFLIMYPPDENKRKCKKVEKLIEEYSLNLYNYETTNYNDLSVQRDDSLLLRKDFNDLIESIRKIYISKGYTYLISYLINRSFVITPGMKRNKTKLETKLDKNRSILMKVLYTVNRDAFLQCFKTKDQMVSK